MSTHPDAVAKVLLAVAAVHGVLRVARVVKLNEGETRRAWPAGDLDVNVADAAARRQGGSAWCRRGAGGHACLRCVLPHQPATWPRTSQPRRLMDGPAVPAPAATGHAGAAGTSPILVEDVLQLALADVRGQVAHIDQAVAHGCRGLRGPPTAGGISCAPGAAKAAAAGAPCTLHTQPAAARPAGGRLPLQRRSRPGVVTVAGPGARAGRMGDDAPVSKQGVPSCPASSATKKRRVQPCDARPVPKRGKPARPRQSECWRSGRGGGRAG